MSTCLCEHESHWTPAAHAYGAQLAIVAHHTAVGAVCADCHTGHVYPPATPEPAPANGDGLGLHPATGSETKHNPPGPVALLDALVELGDRMGGYQVAAASVLGTLTVTAPAQLADAIDRVDAARRLAGGA